MRKAIDSDEEDEEDEEEESNHFLDSEEEDLGRYDGTGQDSINVVLEDSM